MQKNKTATVFGGTGFIGSQVVRELAKKGYRVKVATRVPERAYFLRTCGHVGQIVPFACNYRDEDSIAEAVKGAECVVNCIGILYERRKSAFSFIHTELPQQIARACGREGVRRFVHISALGCDKGTSRYAKSKFEGEKAVKKAFPDVTILRPSVVFGPDDNFFNKFAELARYAPALPLIGGGNTQFQPVYVGDVADAVMAALTLPDVGEADPRGKIYELGGPETVTLREIFERLLKNTGRKRMLVSLPWGLAKIQATFLGMMPHPMLTRDQVESLKTDTTVGKKALTLQDLGITPTGMALILPAYLEPYKPGGRFADKKRA